MQSALLILQVLGEYHRTKPNFGKGTKLRNVTSKAKIPGAKRTKCAGRSHGFRKAYFGKTPSFYSFVSLERE